ncbi:MAG: simple sugar transport system permease protein [Chloroflexi bacterium]|nr:simple sugar transport system permease protein [Chloroflexota bacterium]
MQQSWWRKPKYWLGPLMPVLAVIAALIAGAVMLVLLGVNPFVAYAALVDGAFGSPNSIADTFVKATPLLLVGAGICIAFRGGVINVGGEGQLIVGALAASVAALYLGDLPGWLLITICLILGFLGGAAWGAIPGALKAYLNVNEILTTIMLNAIAIQGMNFLLSGPLMDPMQVTAGSFIPQTARFPISIDLPRLVPTRLHAGVLLAVVAAILVWLLLWRTTIGFRIRAVGLSPKAARRAGIRVERYAMLALILSGALAGLAGAVQVLGVNHRMFTDGSAAGFTGNAGFNGIVAALFGQLHPIGTIPASFFFGALLVGANKMQRVTQVPTSMIIALNGLLVIFVVSSEIWRRRLARQREMEEVAQVLQPASASEEASEG